MSAPSFKTITVPRVGTAAAAFFFFAGQNARLCDDHQLGHRKTLGSRRHLLCGHEIFPELER